MCTLPHDLADHEREAILAHFKSLPEDVRTKNRIFELHLPDRPLFLIKHGSDALDEAYAQHFFYRLSCNDGLAPKIPRVFDAFSDDGFSFLVTAKITAPTLKDAGIAEEEAIGHAAHAIKWLLKQTSSVPKSVFGRISPNDVRVWHKFFKEQQAPRAFDSNNLLQYVKTAFKRCPGKQLDQALLTRLKDSFAKLSVCHSDITRENFLLDTNEQVWMVDFQHVSMLPTIFLEYVFFNVGEKFASDVGAQLGYQASDISNAMVVPSSMLQQRGGNAALVEQLSYSVGVRRDSSTRG
ncbi:hypothetical protein SISSUDRAFT_1133338 [Sistotremastrum suecicum HHB10207 ss-3]|uniref:Aminoglycoside phosphotransferase domain-containing protein n=1 Tax=Sistotremastrum suecicum HHB10207 ss-3 TaxID=1314776 RepID=A0A165XFH3_9AGAM|nr:hypothetical protein SISSUDRAFT_1133338 [Sistotremastrum suecicum HHB10207 ss-3]